MKKVLTLVLAVLLVGSLATAGDNAKPITKAGGAAILFDLGGLANLSADNYQGGLGFKYYFGNNFAGRIGIGFTSTSETDKNPNPTPPPTALGESKLTTLSLSVAPGIQYNVVTSNAVVGYLGGQVSFTTTSQKREGNNGGFGAGFVSGESYKVSSTIFGVAVFVGAEWFPWDNISVSAEYRLGFSTSSGKTEIGNPAPTPGTSFDSPTVTTIGLGSGNAAAFTLAFYI